MAEYGELVGTVLAARAEVTDAHGRLLQPLRPVGLRGRRGRPPPELDRQQGRPRAQRLRRPRPPRRAARAGGGHRRPAYLVSQCETAAYCGLGMTGGAADIVERYAPLSIRDLFVSRLNSLDPDEAWEGGMFLTERQGGSDVGANTTRAVPDGGEWLLFGDKHFCSNVDADVFIVLARPEGAPEGTARPRRPSSSRAASPTAHPTGSPSSG